MAVEPRDDRVGRNPPSATYRVQLNPGFGFDDAAELPSYLAELGVSHLYTSPYLQAFSGSTHGYDVVDPTRVNDELGGHEAHVRMVDALAESGMGHILDIVPNHMAIGSRSNRWWWDVLENGPVSIYAHYFDIDWDPPEAKLRNKVLLAVLGDHYGRILEAGEIQLGRSGSTFTVHYHEHEFPLAPASIEPILSAAAEVCGSKELESLAAALGRLPTVAETDRRSVDQRHRDKEILKNRLGDLLAVEPPAGTCIDQLLAEINADPDSLDQLLERQNYRLAFWRTAAQELDYRRFFDIHTLVALRMEDQQVFEDTHRLILGWIKDGSLDGLRIDHPDGLRDPEGYLKRLAERSSGVWMVVEKILEPGERLPDSWPVAGTTGYDFLNRLTALLVDPAGEEPLTQLYSDLTGETADWNEVVLERKHQVMREVLAADVNRLTNIFVQVCERNRRYRDYTRRDLGQSLREVLASFPVYRTYVRETGGSSRQDDAAYVTRAAFDALSRRPDLDPDLFSLLENVILQRIRASKDRPAEGSASPVTPETELVMRFQQLSGPVMAKGVEDTAFYNYNRFIPLNEVGGDPGRFGTSTGEFHAACEEAQRLWPLGMLASSTHDTKRSEDVRARLALLSEIPELWSQAVRRWMAHNDRFWFKRDFVDRNMEYLLYQTLVGAWPLSEERALAYAEKASREAKTRTSWLSPNIEYESALRDFLQGILADPYFTEDLERFVAPLIAPGRVNSLTQTLLKLTCPGVTDLYQGTELWDFSLVDPDNRRPVDYDHRRKLLAELDGLVLEDIMARADEGLPKMLVIQRGLQLKRRHAQAFGRAGTYSAIPVQGPKASHLVAFSRSSVSVTAVPRLVLGLGGEWKGTEVELPPGRWLNLFTGEEFDAGAIQAEVLLRRFPVALLESASR